jgi:hypothetical protein
MSLCVVFSGMLLLAGCGQEPERVLHNTGDTPPPQQAQADDETAQLPLGHPPVDASGTSGIIPPAAGSGSGATGMTWELPGGWIEETPSSAMRKAQYRVPGSGGDGECLVFYFGPGQGGDAEANAVRWASQFMQPDGTNPVDKMKTDHFEVGDIHVMKVETSGTYVSGGPMMGGGQQENPDYMLLGAIASGPDANWFFKFTGPEETVNAQREAFDTMLRSLKSGT